MMRHLLSDQISDFAAIYEQDVELVSVARPTSNAPRVLPEQRFALRQDVQAKWVQGALYRDAAMSALSTSIDIEALRALTEEITSAVEVLTELLGCAAVGVLVSTLKSPMCPRFRVPSRMLITIDGPGTEWIPNDDVRLAQLGDRETDAVPIKIEREIRRLVTGSWSLLEGGEWDERFAGVVHRSPHQACDRLLVSLDPLFTAQV